MSSDKIALSASMRSDLLNLQRTQKKFDRVQERLATGRRVNNAIDNPSSYFTGRALNARSHDFQNLLDSIGQAISTLNATDDALTSLGDFVSQAESVAQSARDTPNVSSIITSQTVFPKTVEEQDSMLMTDFLGSLTNGDSFTVRTGDATQLVGNRSVRGNQTLADIGIVDADTDIKTPEKDPSYMEVVVDNKIYTFEFDSTAVAGDVTVDANGNVKRTVGIQMTVDDFADVITDTVGRKKIAAGIGEDGTFALKTLDESSLIVRSNRYHFGTMEAETVPVTQADLNAVLGTAGNAVAYGARPSITIAGRTLVFPSADPQHPSTLTDICDMVNADPVFIAREVKAMIDDTGALRIYNEEGTPFTEAVSFSAAQFTPAYSASFTQSAGKATVTNRSNTMYLTGIFGNANGATVDAPAKVNVDGGSYALADIEASGLTGVTTAHGLVLTASGTTLNVTNPDHTQSYTLSFTSQTYQAGTGVRNGTSHVATSVAASDGVVAQTTTISAAEINALTGTDTGGVGMVAVPAALSVSGAGSVSLADLKAATTMTLGNVTLTWDDAAGLTVSSLNTSAVTVSYTAQTYANPTENGGTVYGRTIDAATLNAKTTILSYDALGANIGYHNSAPTVTDASTVTINGITYPTAAIRDLSADFSALTAMGITLTRQAGGILLTNNNTGAGVTVTSTCNTYPAGTWTNGSSTAVSIREIHDVEGFSSANFQFGLAAGKTVALTEDMTVEEFRREIDALENVSAEFTDDGRLKIYSDNGDKVVIADKTGIPATLLGIDGISKDGANNRKNYADQFDRLLKQIDEMTADSRYKGVNLLQGDDLRVVFNENRTSTLDIKGVMFDSVGLGLNAAENDWEDNASIDKALQSVMKARSLIREQSEIFGQNLSTVQIRESFTEDMVNKLADGADKLTLADMNEEAASLLALQTRQQLGTNALSMASQADQGVLKLFQ